MLLFHFGEDVVHHSCFVSHIMSFIQHPSLLASSSRRKLFRKEHQSYVLTAMMMHDDALFADRVGEVMNGYHPTGGEHNKIESYCSTVQLECSLSQNNDGWRLDRLELREYLYYNQFGALPAENEPNLKRIRHHNHNSIIGRSECQRIQIISISHAWIVDSNFKFACASFVQRQKGHYEVEHAILV